MHHTTKQVQHRLMGLILFSLTLFLILSANSGGVQAVEPTGPTEIEMVTLMERHYEVTILAHDALIQGDLEKMRSQLSRIVEQTLPASAPPSWRPHHVRLQEAATSGASRMSSLASAGSVMANVAEACGSCHAALKVSNIYYRPAPPAKDDQLKTAMRTHQWASERLWEGVTGPLEEAWPRGADALADIRLFATNGETVKGSLRVREDELREMGRKAKTTTGLHERAAIYGRLLTTCAGCHQEAGVTIAPAKAIPLWQK